MDWKCFGCGSGNGTVNILALDVIREIGQILEINWKMDWNVLDVGSRNGIGRLLNVLDVVPKPWAKG